MYANERSIASVTTILLGCTSVILALLRMAYLWSCSCGLGLWYTYELLSVQL